MKEKTPVRLSYFSDVLCVWAYVAQIRLDELKHHFGEAVQIDHHFMPVFGAAHKRIGDGWKDQGGFEGFNHHLAQVCQDFPHVELHDQVWLASQPRSSSQAHLFIKAVQLLEQQGVISDARQHAFHQRTIVEELVWCIRAAFFQRVMDISDLAVLFDLGDELGLPREQIVEQLNNGAAMAALWEDKELCEHYKVDGSPSYILNEGRQKLYGNVGYKILETNVHEVLNRPYNQASWC